MSTAPITAELSAGHHGSMTALSGLFFESLGKVTPVSHDDLPSEYAKLLHHSGHMTVSLEAWHKSPVSVSIKAEATDAASYARHSLLHRTSDGRVVQSGILRIALTELERSVREEIEAGEEPLGRILIRNNLLREVELLALWRIKAGAILAKELTLTPGDTVYGRSARILVEGHTAVELLEIVCP